MFEGKASLTYNLFTVEALPHELNLDSRVRGNDNAEAGGQAGGLK
jgi:hypothetical protein